MEMGGVQKILAAKASFLSEMGHDVLILVSNAKGVLCFEYDEKVQFKIYSLKNNGLNYFFAYKKLIEQTALEFKPTHVFVLDNGLKGLFVPYFNLQKAVCIYERHGEILVEQKAKPKSFYQNCYNFCLKKTYKTAARAFDAIVVLNEFGLQEWSHKNLYVIPNFTSIQNVSQNNLESQIILFVGRFQPEKGYDLLYQIWSKIANLSSDWQLHLYTDQPFEVQNDITQNHVLSKDRIHVFGVEKNPETLYKQGSLMMATSKSEGFSLVLAEAMTFGIPCIAFDCDFGPRGIIENETNGFLIPLFEVDLFVEKLNLLMKDQDLRSKMGQNAKKSSERFQPELIMKQWENLIDMWHSNPKS
jgi:glycosyltransferase involved in cell wall biosynthesis